MFLGGLIHFFWGGGLHTGKRGFPDFGRISLILGGFAPLLGDLPQEKGDLPHFGGICPILGGFAPEKRGFSQFWEDFPHGKGDFPHLRSIFPILGGFAPFGSHQEPPAPPPEKKKPTPALYLHNHAPPALRLFYLMALICISTPTRRSLYSMLFACPRPLNGPICITPFPNKPRSFA